MCTWGRLFGVEEQEPISGYRLRAPARQAPWQGLVALLHLPAHHGFPTQDSLCLVLSAPGITALQCDLTSCRCTLQLLSLLLIPCQSQVSAIPWSLLHFCLPCHLAQWLSTWLHTRATWRPGKIPFAFHNRSIAEGGGGGRTKERKVFPCQGPSLDQDRLYGRGGLMSDYVGGEG